MDGSALQNNMAARALDKKYLKTTSPEPVVQIQGNFTEMFLIMPSAKIAYILFALPNKMATIALDKKYL